jgi:hypothetical protein
MVERCRLLVSSTWRLGTKLPGLGPRTGPLPNAPCSAHIHRDGGLHAGRFAHGAPRFVGFRRAGAHGKALQTSPSRARIDHRRTILERAALMANLARSSLLAPRASRPDASEGVENSWQADGAGAHNRYAVGGHFGAVGPTGLLISSKWRPGTKLPGLGPRTGPLPSAPCSARTAKIRPPRDATPNAHAVAPLFARSRVGWGGQKSCKTGPRLSSRRGLRGGRNNVENGARGRKNVVMAMCLGGHCGAIPLSEAPSPGSARSWRTRAWSPYCSV